MHVMREESQSRDRCPSALEVLQLSHFCQLVHWSKISQALGHPPPKQADVCVIKKRAKARGPDPLPKLWGV